jgi:hypothetical protein
MRTLIDEMLFKIGKPRWNVHALKCPRAETSLRINVHALKRPCAETAALKRPCAELSGNPIFRIVNSLCHFEQFFMFITFLFVMTLFTLIDFAVGTSLGIIPQPFERVWSFNLGRTFDTLLELTKKHEIVLAILTSRYWYLHHVNARRLCSLQNN